MRKITNALTIFVAVAYSALTIYLWGAMVFTGDDGLSWRRSIDVFDLYLDMYGILLFSVLSFPAVALGLWRSASILGFARDREGVRWAGNLLLGMVVVGLVIISVRYQLWNEIMGTKAAAEQKTVPSDERLEYPALPLAEEGPLTWSLEDLKGTKVEMADLKGKTIFINIWATWCGYCVLEFPGIQRLYEQFKDDPNVVFLVVSDEPALKVQEWRDGKGAEFNLPFYLTKDGFPNKLAPRGYPTTHIIAPDGRIAFSHTGAVAWDGEKTINFLKQLSRSL